jgi:transcriptional regulator with XRE-family HTH domain
MLQLAVATDPAALKYSGMDPAVLGARVRALRLKRNLTQGALAKLAHVAPNTIRGLERATADTRHKQYLRIVKALETTTAMLERADEPIAPDDPRLEGLPDEALEIAQAYTRAPTRTRLRVERFLLMQEEIDGGVALLDRIERLTAHRQETLRQQLAAHEVAQRAEEAKKRR